MAPNVIDELDSQLASLNQLKPPGASKTKINSITALCVNNIQVRIREHIRTLIAPKSGN
jgi:protein NRD1